MKELGRLTEESGRGGCTPTPALSWYRS